MRMLRLALVLLSGIALLQPTLIRAQPNPVLQIKLASQTPLSGPQSIFGVAIRDAIQLAVEDFADTGQRLGVKVSYIPYDDRAQPDVGVANARRIVADSEVLAVVGHLNSSVAIRSSEVYKEFSLAMVSPANTWPLVTDRRYTNILRIIGRDDVQGLVGAEFAVSDLSARTAFIIHDRTAYGQGTAEFFRARANVLGLQVLGFEGADGGTRLEELLSSVQARNPNVVYFGGIYDQAAMFFRAARQRGINAAFLGPDGLDSSELGRVAGDAVVGLHYTTVVGPATFYPGAREFIDRFRSRFRTFPPPFAAQGYDAARLVLSVIAKLMGSPPLRLPSREEVVESLRKERYQGITGPIAFDAKGDLLAAPYFVIRVSSSDPAQWGQNRLVKAIRVNPPP